MAAMAWTRAPASPTPGGHPAQLSKQGGLHTQGPTATSELLSDDGTDTMDVEAATVFTAGSLAKLKGMPKATAKAQTRTVPLKQHLKAALGWSTGPSQAAGSPGFSQIVLQHLSSRI